MGNELEYQNEDTHRRAKELARLAGETITEAVDKAIAERLERIREKRNTKAVAARLLAIGQRCSRLPVLDNRGPEQMLYDDRGWPR